MEEYEGSGPEEEEWRTRERKLDTLVNGTALDPGARKATLRRYGRDGRS